MDYSTHSNKYNIDVSLANSIWNFEQNSPYSKLGPYSKFGPFFTNFYWSDAWEFSLYCQNI